jgi:hypothetical protein
MRRTRYPISASRARGRLAAAAVRRLTPFIGRQDELRLLLNRWDQVRDGEGQVVLIVGEAAIGTDNGSIKVILLP